MTLAERIERVFHWLQFKSSECPAEFAEDVKFIKNRYSELKSTIDFESASQQAKTEWLVKVIIQHSDKIHNYYRD